MTPGRRRWPGRGWLSARRWAAAAAALAVLAAGCSGSGTAGSRPAAPEPSTLAGYYAQRLDWQPCDNGFQCARLLVPFDYAHPGTKSFSLPVIKLSAADPDPKTARIGALVINPGGPGGSGVSCRGTTSGRRRRNIQ